MPPVLVERLLREAQYFTQSLVGAETALPAGRRRHWAETACCSSRSQRRLELRGLKPDSTGRRAEEAGGARCIRWKQLLSQLEADGTGCRKEVAHAL